MLVRPDEKVPIARLLTFLEYGKRMAHDCAKAQAALSEDAGTQQFLLSQAKQEAMPAVVFQGAIAWLAPKHLRDPPSFQPWKSIEHFSPMHWPVMISWNSSWPSKWCSKA
jgi:hypothetical protein